MRVRIFLLCFLFLSVTLSFGQKSSKSFRKQTNLTQRDVSETISSFKTSDASKSVRHFRKKLSIPIENKELRKNLIQKIGNEFGRLRLKNEKLEKKVRKLISPVLSLYKRQNSYKLIILKHKVPYIMSNSGVVIVITTGLLTEVKNDDELLGFVAHEIGHEYFAEYTKYSEHLFKTIILAGDKEKALRRQFANALAILELQCDAFSAISLTHLGYNPIAFIEGLERMHKKFPTDPKTYHPPDEMRRRVVSEVILNTSVTLKQRKVSPILKEIKEYLALGF